MKQMLTISLLFIVFFAAAQPGTNDPSFGINGVVIRKGIAGTYQDVFVSPNNKILAIRGYGDTIVTITQYTTIGIPQKNIALSVYIKGPYQNKKGLSVLFCHNRMGNF